MGQERDQGLSDAMARRATAGRAPGCRGQTVAAFSADARSTVVVGPSASQNGSTRMPVSTAPLTAVVKDNTSTMTGQAASRAGRPAPAGTHAKRIPPPGRTAQSP